ncbi:D-tyrosyl-tRNA(Tyr) deacylase [Nitrogeniibacter mangrovi]|uniref:D-aminoacyl-tRNA deacylase n=1 Tax=Nitrogeniibacter mangrovi TaxID=2016596 RepID=A0A6C1B2L2_9RHOO|nr:D-aminoacyl-tRNA deacylase [Nitrogeniibacter mangrovi]QID17882.1 D-tyrosyl-tRNA(Tyr) deacylase [Nitrogeniibacter mangrovi]
MIALIQRVSHASVVVAGETVGRIDAGLLALIGVQPDDDPARCERMLERLLGYRVFADDAGRMNRSLVDTGGGLLLVPQFTLAADTRKGTRPGFSTAAPPERAAELFDDLCARARARHPFVASGRFGADMAVSLTNQGPVTFWLEA